MFAISYSAPSARDPNQRDAYFTGQKTGWDQMAEVASDRNQKRQIELERQRVALAKQQEARIARENAETLEINKQKLALEEASAPVIAAKQLADLAETQTKTQVMLESLQKGPDFSDRSYRNQQVIMQGGTKSAAQTAIESSAPSTKTRTVETMTTPEVETPRVVIQEAPETKRLNQNLNNMLQRTAGSGVINRKREASNTIAAAKAIESSMLASPIKMSLGTGFGVQNGSQKQSYNFEENEDWKNF